MHTSFGACKEALLLIMGFMKIIHLCLDGWAYKLNTEEAHNCSSHATFRTKTDSVTNSLLPSVTVALADLRREDLLLPPNMGSSSIAPGMDAGN